MLSSDIILFNPLGAFSRLRVQSRSRLAYSTNKNTFRTAFTDSFLGSSLEVEMGACLYRKDNDTLPANLSKRVELSSVRYRGDLGAGGAISNGQTDQPGVCSPEHSNPYS